MQLQRSEKGTNEAWRAYCRQHGSTGFDPCRHDGRFLQEFLRAHGKNAPARKYVPTRKYLEQQISNLRPDERLRWRMNMSSVAPFQDRTNNDNMSNKRTSTRQKSEHPEQHVGTSETATPSSGSDTECDSDNESDSDGQWACEECDCCYPTLEAAEECETQCLSKKANAQKGLKDSIDRRAGIDCSRLAPDRQIRIRRYAAGYP